MKSLFDIERRAIGASIFTIRTREGMTQKEVADAAGLRRHQVNRVEKGNYNSTLDTLLKIAVVLKFDILCISKNKINEKK